MDLHATERSAEHLAAGVVEVDIDPLGQGFLELVPEVRALVVDRRVEAEFLGEQAALRLPAGNADDRRQPAILAIWPTRWPTEPAAAETRTVWPSFGSPTSKSPK